MLAGALVADEPTEQARESARQPRDDATETHSACESSCLTERGENQQRAKDHIEPPIAEPSLKRSSGQPARGTRQSKAPKDPAVDAALQKPKA